MQWIGTSVIIGSSSFTGRSSSSSSFYNQVPLALFGTSSASIFSLFTPAGAVDSNHFGIDLIETWKSAGRYCFTIFALGGHASKDGCKFSGVGYDKNLWSLIY